MHILEKLAVNLAVVGLFVSLWVQLSPAISHRYMATRNLVFGLMMGGATISSMLMSVPLQPGVFFDVRNSLMALSGLFGGPVAIGFSLLLASGYRLWVGGVGAGPAVTAMSVSAIMGLGGHFWAGRRVDMRHIALVAIGSGVAALLGLLTLPRDVSSRAFGSFGLPLSTFTVLLRAVGSALIVRAARAARLRDLLQAALVQSPDYQYVKDSDGRFVAVNQNVAQLHGRQHPASMLGLSVDDLEEPERANQLRALEIPVLERGEPLLNFEEELFPGGEGRWFRSSKVALHDRDGEIIGLAGVSQDITQNKTLEAELRASRDTLAFVTANMSDGLAMFDRNGTLVFCNEQYRSAFPLTSAVRLPGVNLRKILQAVVDTGEQVSHPGAPTGQWIEQVMGTLLVASEEQIELYDGRWLLSHTRPAQNGNALVVISDITSLKASERELHRLTGELETLAATDGLMGLLNRRAFDAALTRSLARGRDTGAPISLLLVDVDHFKNYNDHYGHVSGDECLTLLSRCMRESFRGAHDIVARYGGEEFVGILPDTGEDEAFAVAERLRASIEALKIANVGSIHEVVTVSIGICCANVSAGALTPGQLIERSDQALYEAKAAGRNRVIGWRATRAGRLAGSLH